MYILNENQKQHKEQKPQNMKGKRCLYLIVITQVIYNFITKHLFP